jgi:uncharacterized RDD family membrane protein YckC
MQFDQNPPDLLADEVYYERASAGKRLANYIIDFIVFYVLVAIFAVVLAISSPATFNSWTSGGDSFGLVDRILTLFFYAMYMSIVEALLKGKSVGKFITRTRAVNLDGTPLLPVLHFQGDLAARFLSVCLVRWVVNVTPGRIDGPIPWLLMR